MSKLITRLLLGVLFVLGAVGANAQVDVTATGGTPTASYPTLKDAFDAVNAGTHTGTISIGISANTTETASAVLNASGSGSASYTSIGISPTGGATRTISGSIAGHLIDLNGADNVTVDGLNSGGNSLIIENTSTAATPTVIRFIADATTNTIQNCTIKGSGTGAALGTIFFSTGTTSGNDGNIVTGNTITVSTTTPTNAIYSAGTSAAIDNSGISVTNNSIQDYYNAGAASNGIFIASNSSAWTITGNKLFQSATRTATAGSTHMGIQIVTASGVNYTISNNTIGYATSSATGSTTYAGAFASRFYGMDLTLGTATVSNIQGNTINGFTFSTTSGATTAGAGIFQGITVRSGLVNIGTTTGNTIGATSGTGSINITSTTTAGYIAGIYLTATVGATIQNNTIGSINTGGLAAIGYTFVGIDVAGAGASHTITNNTVGSSTANSIAIGISGTTTASTTAIGIRSSATGTTVSIGIGAGTGNTIQNMSSFGSGTASVWYGISTSGASGTLNINYNTFTANALAGGGASTTTIYYSPITNSGASTVALNVNNNTFNSGTISTATYAGGSTLVFSTAGGSASAVSIQNNTFTGLVFTGATGSTGSFYGIYHSNSAGIVTSKIISNNQFNNLTLKSSGQVILIYTNDLTLTVTVSNNSIGTQFTRSVSSNAGLYGIFSANATGASSGTHIVTNNTLSNITSTTTSTATTGVVGIIWEPGASGTSSPTVTISGNTLSNYSNSSTSPMAGIIADWSKDLTISGNTISDLTSGGAAVTGIQTAVIGTVGNVYKNKIFNLSSTNVAGIVRGVLVQSSSSAASPAAFNIYNNLIGNLTAPSSSGNNQVMGISTDGTDATRTHNIYYNTIYLNASGGANFGSSAISVTTAPTVVMRNNILTNTSTAAGTGFTVVYRRSTTTLGTYGAASNNNDFYAGPTTSSPYFIYYDGTTGYQMAGYKSLVSGRDAASITEDPEFQSTTGSSADFLKYKVSSPKQIESGAANISTYTNDYFGTIRQGNGGYSGTGTAPDMGAWELEGIGLDLTAPAISAITVVGNACSVTSRNVTATIADGTGVDNSATFRPRIYFQKNGLGYVSAQGTLTSGTVNSGTWTFTITYAAIGGVIPTDAITYYIVAQDVAGTPNVGGNPSAGLVLTDVNTVTTPPTTPLTYTIGNTLAGSYNVGAGQIYTTLTAAIAAYNTSCLGGAVTFLLTDAAYTEAAAMTINANTDVNATNTLTIKPTLANTTIAVTGGSTTAIFNLNGADYVTIDGSIDATANTICPPVSAGRDLTITNTNSSTTSAVVWLQTNVADGATNNTVKNCNIVGNSNITTLIGIGSGSSTISTASLGTGNNSNSIINNNISKTQHGIYSQGASAANKNTGTTINQNLINAASPNNVQTSGIRVGFESGIQIRGNNIANLSNVATSTPTAAIMLGMIPSNSFTSFTGNEVTGATVSNNVIDNIVNTIDRSCAGISVAQVTTASSPANNIVNNMISGVRAPASTPSDFAVGIMIGGGAQGSSNVYFNTVSLTGIGTSTGPGYGIAVGGSNPVVDIRNNIFVNKMTSTSGIMYAIGLAYSTFTNLTSNNNDFFTTASSLAQTGALGSGTDRATLAAWQTATTKDGASKNVDVVFTGGLHIDNTNAINLANLNGSGASGTGVTDDIDCDSRGSLPDIGADQFIGGGLWTGAGSSVWDAATTGNWEDGIVPAVLANVVIPSGAANMPVLTGYSPIVTNLSLAAGSTLSINGNTLTINGAVSGTGTLSGSSASSLTIDGAAGTLNFTSGSRALSNLTLTSGSAALGTALDIYGVLTVTAGTLNLASQAVTLKSTASGTARVAPILGTLTPAGASNVTVERYINSDVVGRKWHLLSGISTASGQTIRQSWQENGGAASNLGTWITSGSSSLPGYDATSANTASILSYNAVTPAWVTPAATNTGSINDNQGYMLFVRGDRNALPSNALTAPTVLRTTGTLRQGTQAGVTILNTNPGYTMLGNPYASPIDFEAISGTTNLSPFFYVWDASYAGTYGVGGFRLVERTGAGTYTATPGTGSDNTLGFIHSGQAFFVKTTGAGDASVAFNESSKATSLSVVNPIVAGRSDQQIYTSLVVMGNGTTENLADAVRVRFNDGYTAATTDDAPKMGNFNENISSYRDNKKLIVELRPMIAGKDTIFLFMNNMGVNNYRFKVSSIDFIQPDIKAWLQDSYTGKNTALDLTGNTLDIDFSVTGDAASANSNRFRIVFENKTLQQPQTSTIVRAAQQGTAITVDWKASNQYNMKQYEVEKSTDGVNYTTQNTRAAIGINGSNADYSWLDVNPAVGDNYYRIRSIGIGGDVKISQPVVVTIAKGNRDITVYPNPVTDRTVSLKFTDMEKGIYQLRLVNTTGQVVLTKTINHNGGSAIQKLPLGREAAKGVYRLEITGTGGSKTTIPVLIAD